MAELKKYLITGFSGFVSHHFLDYLEQNKMQAEIVGVDTNAPDFDFNVYNHLNCSFKKIDLLDKTQVENIFADFAPDYVLHLASYSSVAFSWQHPVESFANNTNIFLNLIETIRLKKINCRVLSVGSSEEYGNVAAADLPLKENMHPKPLSPYAVARVSQEMLSKIYVDGYGMDIVLTRSFNHIGPRQKPVFVIPSFAKQLVEMKKNNAAENILTTGDTSIVRDFVDVRDVVHAYHLLFNKGIKGEVYNICSGTGTSLNGIIDAMSAMLEIKVEKQLNSSLVRPNDNKIIIGDSSKIKSHTLWQPSYNLQNSLADIISCFVKR
jgi:GDP-4-dehydro-6-deoxy-D-mannose reductase